MWKVECAYEPVATPIVCFVDVLWHYCLRTPV